MMFLTNWLFGSSERFATVDYPIRDARGYYFSSPVQIICLNNDTEARFTDLIIVIFLCLDRWSDNDLVALNAYCISFTFKPVSICFGSEVFSV